MLSKEQRELAVQAVIQTGRERQSKFGQEFNDVDFVCGAMAVLYALGVPMAEMPSLWVMGPLLGRNAITGEALPWKDE